MSPLHEKRQRAIQDFEALFRAAEKPVLEVPAQRFERVLLVLEWERTPLNDSVLGVAAHVIGRFRPEVICLTTPPSELTSRSAREVLDDAEERLRFEGCNLTSQLRAGVAPDAVIEVVDEWVPSLVIIPCPYMLRAHSVRGYSLGATVDVLTRARDLPTLLIKDELPAPADVFRRPVAYLPNVSESAHTLSVSFSLIEDDGELCLLHVMDDLLLELDKDLLQFAVDVDPSGELTAVRQAVERQVTALLQSAARAADDRPFELRYQLRAGSPPMICREVINDCGATLFIVDTEVHGLDSFTTESDDLVRVIDETPVLAI